MHINHVGNSIRVRLIRVVHFRTVTGQLLNDVVQRCIMSNTNGSICGSCDVRQPTVQSPHTRRAVCLYTAVSSVHNALSKRRLRIVGSVNPPGRLECYDELQLRQQ